MLIQQLLDQLSCTPVPLGFIFFMLLETQTLSLTSFSHMACFLFFSFFHIGSHVAQPNTELLVLLPLALKGWDHHYVLPCLALFLMSYLGSEQTYSLNTQLPPFIYYWSPLTSNIQRTKTACLWSDWNFELYRMKIYLECSKSLEYKLIGLTLTVATYPWSCPALSEREIK